MSGCKTNPTIIDNLYDASLVSLKGKITDAMNHGDTIWIRAATGGKKGAAEILKANYVAMAVTKYGHEKGYTGNYPVYFSDGAMYFVCEPKVCEKDRRDEF